MTEQEQPVTEQEQPVTETAESHDESDVDAALELETDDGKGGAVVPRTDFVSYEADEDVTAYNPEDEG